MNLTIDASLLTNTELFSLGLLYVLYILFQVMTALSIPFAVLYFLFRDRSNTVPTLTSATDTSTTPHVSNMRLILTYAGRVAKIMFMLGLYLFVGGMSVMATDSCSAAQCKLLGAGLGLAYVWLGISAIVTSIYTFYDTKPIPRYLTATRPHWAFIIFFCIMFLSAALQASFN